MAVVFSPFESFPPTASSRPCTEAHVEKVPGVSASWCHTSDLLRSLDLPVSDKVFSRAPRDCGWQDWRRAASEQEMTNRDGNKS